MPLSSCAKVLSTQEPVSILKQLRVCYLRSNFLCLLVIYVVFFVNCVYFMSMFCCVLKVALQAGDVAQL